MNDEMKIEDNVKGLLGIIEELRKDEDLARMMFKFLKIKQITDGIIEFDMESAKKEIVSLYSFLAVLAGEKKIMIINK